MTTSTGGQPIPERIPLTGGSGAKEREVVALLNPEVDKIDPTTTTPISEEQGATILENPADTGVDVPLIMTATSGNNKLSGAENAVINPKKLTEYALNPDHPVGRHKARVFESALGFNKDNADDLLKQLYQGVKTNGSNGDMHLMKKLI